MPILYVDFLLGPKPACKYLLKLLLVSSLYSLYNFVPFPNEVSQHGDLVSDIDVLPTNVMESSKSSIDTNPTLHSAFSWSWSIPKLSQAKHASKESW